MRPKYLRIGPNEFDGCPTIEVQLETGELVHVLLRPVQARQVADRLLECASGRIANKPPSRRVMQLTLAAEPEACDVPFTLAVGHA